MNTLRGHGPEMHYETDQDQELPVDLLKQPKGYNPAREISDLKLAPGVYILCGNEVKVGSAAETKGGIYVPVMKNTKIPNMAIVVAKAETGCERADVGDYVVMPSYGGNDHDDKKAFPFVRWLGDEGNLWVIREDSVHVVLPPAKKMECVEE